MSDRILGNIWVVVRIETNGVMFATTSKLGWSTGYHGELGRIFGLLSLLQTNGKRVPSDSSFFVPFRDFLHICPAFCLFFFLVCYLLVIWVTFPRRDGHIWRWFLKRCKLSRPGRAYLRSRLQASGVTVATDMICVVGRFLGSKGPRAWFCNG